MDTFSHQKQKLQDLFYDINARLEAIQKVVKSTSDQKQYQQPIDWTGMLILFYYTPKNNLKMVKKANIIL